jgi:hypothetical protein
MPSTEGSSLHIRTSSFVTCAPRPKTGIEHRPDIGTVIAQASDHLSDIVIHQCVFTRPMERSHGPMSVGRNNSSTPSSSDPATSSGACDP